MAEMIEIRNQSDIFRLIKKIETAKVPFDGQQIRFIDGPHYELTIRGENFDGGIPTRIMPGLMELQRTVDKAYARIIYGAKRRLSEQDKKKTELIVHVERGSTKFVVDLTNTLNHAISNMTGIETLIAILGVALITGGTFVWKAYINNAAKDRELDFRAKLSVEETERHKATLELAEKIAPVRETLSDMHRTQVQFLKRLDANDDILLDGQPLVDGSIGKSLVEPVYKNPVHDRLDATFIILSVYSGNVSGGFRMRVKDIATQEEYKVFIPGGTLPQDQIDQLQKGEWDKVPLHMQINIERKGKKITKAVLTSAGLSPVKN